MTKLLSGPNQLNMSRSRTPAEIVLFKTRLKKKLNSFGLWRTMGRGGACCGGDEAGDKVEYDPANGDYRYHNL